MAITKKALEYLGFKNKTDFVLQDDGDGVYIRDWLSDSTKPTDSAINTADTQAQTAYDAKAYARKRAAEYPLIADQLDDIYHNGIDAWKATIKTTKDKYPKP